ncbi:MAG: hypothetical protein AAFW73_22090 [Bacteroidota bacterium]
MPLIPRRLRSMIPAREILQVESWWQKLPPDNRAELQDLYDETPADGERLVPIYLCGRFVEQERVDRQEVFWVNHFYDYLINHELIVDQRPQVGGICSAQVEAVRVIRTGLIPTDFRCPLGGKACLMLRLLARRPGWHLQFFVRFQDPRHEGSAR